MRDEVRLVGEILSIKVSLLSLAFARPAVCLAMKRAYGMGGREGEIPARHDAIERNQQRPQLLLLLQQILCLAAG